MSTPEGEVLKSVCEYLALKRHFFFRSNNIPPVQRFKDGSMTFRRLPAYSVKGIPDIICIREGRFIGIECKAANGRLSPDQVVFEQLCIRNGGVYIVARSIDDVRSVGL
jgi:hypothetical protein